MKDEKLVEKLLKMTEPEITYILSRCIYTENDVLPYEMGTAITLLRNSFHVPRCKMVLEGIRMVRSVIVNNTLMEDFQWILLAADIKQIFITVLLIRIPEERIKQVMCSFGLS